MTADDPADFREPEYRRTETAVLARGFGPFTEPAAGTRRFRACLPTVRQV